MTQHPPPDDDGDHRSIDPGAQSDWPPDAPVSGHGLKAGPCHGVDLHPHPADGVNRPRLYNSDQLFADQAEVLIRHGQDIYRLRATARGGLILTK